MVDRCVMCGEIIPEGSWVCPKCQKAYQKTCEDCGRTIWTRSNSTKRCKECSHEHKKLMDRVRVKRWRKGF